MKFLSLDYIKQHSRIEYDCEDSTLEEYANGAEETIASYLNRGKTVDNMVESLVEEYGYIPTNLYIAGQMLVDLSYTQRNPVSMQRLYAIPYAFDNQVKPYMKL